MVIKKDTLINVATLMDGSNLSCFKKCSHLIQNPFFRSGFGQINIIITAVFNMRIKKANDCLKSGAVGPQQIVEILGDALPDVHCSHLGLLLV